MEKHRIGVIGLGKIAQDQHLPVIAKSGSFELAAVSSQAPGPIYENAMRSLKAAAQDVTLRSSFASVSL